MMKIRALLLPLALALPFTACSSDKNHAEREAAPEAQGRHPDYASMSVDELMAACVGACKPDPGSRPIDVAKAESGYQFAWLWQLDTEGLAKSTYTYDDNTSSFVLPVRTISKFAPAWGGWEPTAIKMPEGSAGPAWAVRFKGGPFTEYGGGFGQSMRTTTNGDSRNPLLAQTPSKEFPGMPESSSSPGSGGAYDVSSWTGLAIWVRRGPDGQSTMRLGITERNSAEDLNSSAITFADATKDVPGVAEGRYCQRWRLCGCSGGTPCTEVAADEFRCVDPALDAVTDSSRADPDFEIKYPKCGVTRCMQGNSSTEGEDPLFNGHACSEARTSDGRSDMFCYDPGKDPSPPAKRERCNNPFSRPITVTTDWQLIKVPFSDLRQADEAKVSSEMDLHSVKQFVVTYSGGWIDFWVANIGFYKKL